MPKRGRTGRVVSATGLAVCLLGAPLVATAAPSGVDDGINVTHYGVNLHYQRDPEILSGVTTILAEASRKLPRFDLSLLLAVSSVTVNNEPAGFTAKDGKLTVTPKEPIAAGSQLVIVVRYRDNPARHPGWGWVNTPTGAVAASAPQWWYPSAVDPADRATQSVVIVVPKGLEAVSNGELPTWEGPESVPGGDRWSWWNKTPQSAGASLLAIGQYELTTSTGSDGRPFTRAYSADLGAVGARARASVERTPEILRALANFFGPAPFKAEGGLVDSTFGGVMGTATRPIYAANSFDGGENASMVAHEIAHQWYGVQVNAVGPDTQWLSEGFATYAEFLWSELEGLGTAAEVAQWTRCSPSQLRTTPQVAAVAPR